MMNKNKILILLVLSIFVFGFFRGKDQPGPTGRESSEKIQWMSFEEALAQSEKDAKDPQQKVKKVFIDVYTDWCGWCKRMDATTFSNPDIAAYVNENFYAVKLDAEQREDIIFNNNTFKYVQQGKSGYHELAVALLKGRLSFPTVVFLDEEFKMIQPIPGYLPARQFDAIIHYLGEEHFMKTPWDEFNKSYVSAVK